MALIDIQGEIDRILQETAGKQKKLNFGKPKSILPNALDNGFSINTAKKGIDRLETFGTLANSGGQSGMAAAYQIAQKNLDAAINSGDSAGAAYWSSALNSLGAGLQDMSTESGGGGGGGGGGSPYDQAMALAKIYDTAVGMGTMKAGAADKALQAALDQAKLTSDKTYVPGWEPYGMVSGMLSTPWGNVGEAGRYTKVKVPDADTISKAAEDGFNQALAALLGSMPGGGGSGGGGGGGASAGYSSPQGGAAAAGAGPAQAVPQTAVGDAGASPISAIVDDFLNNSDSYNSYTRPGAVGPNQGPGFNGVIDWGATDVPFWADPNNVAPDGWPSVGSAPQLGPQKKRPFWQRGLGF